MAGESISNQDWSEHECLHIIGENLAQDPRVPLRNIRVSMEDGDVVLRGVVDCVAQKEAAEEDANRVPGGIRVINEIGVRPERAVDDGEIAREVMKAILADDRLQAGNFEAASKDRVVTLRGEAVTEIEKRAALDVAGSVYGVEEVVSEVVVLPTGNITDHMLEEQVAEELSRAPALHEKTIHPHVEDGIVYLRGTVDLPIFEEEAICTACGVPGVREVRSELQISGVG